MDVPDSLSVEDLVHDVTGSSIFEYDIHIREGIKAFKRSKFILTLDRRNNPHPDLDEFFQHLDQNDDFYFKKFPDENVRGTPEKLTRADVIAIYGRIKEIYDRTTGLNFLDRYFGPIAEMRNALPDICDVVDYVKEHGPL